MRYLCIIVTALVCLLTNVAYARVYVDISKGNTDAFPIGLPGFMGEESSDQDTAGQIASVVQSDLLNSGFFALSGSSSTQSMDSLSVAPDYDVWTEVGAHALLTGVVHVSQDGMISISTRLYDVLQQKILDGESLSAPKKDLRRLAHIIADDVYRQLTGVKGYFDSRIAFVALVHAKGLANPVRRLAIADSDGYNMTYFTDDSMMVLAPRLSPSKNEVAYVLYSNGNPNVILHNLNTGAEFKVGPGYGISFSPCFSYDGKKLYFSYSLEGNTDIFVMDIATKKVRRLTDDHAIDTSPSPSPDGKYVAYTSDKSGLPQIYVMRRDGSHQNRISYGDGSYKTPAWSPNGDMIAFTKQYQDTFFIGVMDPKGRKERIVSSGYFQESPTWGPYGHMLMFMRQSTYKDRNDYQIYRVDINGSHLKKIKLYDKYNDIIGVTDPSWAPFSK